MKKLLIVFMLLLAGVVHAQEDVPPLTETYSGRGRLADVDFNYPADWFTLGGVPVNRLISFNVVSSVPLGIRNQIEPGQEAIVLAISGGRVDRWADIAADDSLEEVLTTFLERLGNDNQFSGERPADAEEDVPDFELVVEETTFNGYEAVRMRFVAAMTAVTEEPAPAATEETEDAFSGDFVAYALRLDDNRFVVVLSLTSELTFEQAQPTIEGILGTLTFGS